MVANISGLHDPLDYFAALHKTLTLSLTCCGTRDRSDRPENLRLLLAHQNKSSATTTKHKTDMPAASAVDAGDSCISFAAFSSGVVEMYVVALGVAGRTDAHATKAAVGASRAEPLHSQIIFWPSI